MEQTDEQKLLALGETGFDTQSNPEDTYAGYENAGNDEDGYFGRPEKYDYSDVELPDNYSYNEELLEEFNELAGKYNLSQKSANELMAVAVKLAKLTDENFSKAAAEQHRQQILANKRALVNDSILGGNNLAKNIQTANVAYTEFADEEVQRLMQASGLNCHPKIVQMFYKIGKNMQDDSFFGINSAPIQKESREDILFPTMA